MTKRKAYVISEHGENMYIGFGSLTKIKKKLRKVLKEIDAEEHFDEFDFEQITIL